MLKSYKDEIKVLTQEGWETGLAKGIEKGKVEVIKL